MTQLAVKTSENHDYATKAIELYKCYGFWDDEARALEIIREAKSSNNLEKLVDEFNRLLSDKKVEGNFYTFITSRLDSLVGDDVLSFLKIIYPENEAHDVYDLYNRISGVTHNSGLYSFLIECSGYNMTTGKSLDCQRLKKLIENYSKCFNTSKSGELDFFKSEINYELSGTEYLSTISDIIDEAHKATKQKYEAKEERVNKDGKQEILSVQREGFLILPGVHQSIDLSKDARDLYNSFGYVYHDEDRALDIIKRAKALGVLDKLISEFDSLLEGEGRKENFYTFLSARFDSSVSWDGYDLKNFLDLMFGENESNDIYQLYTRMEGITPTSNHGLYEFIIMAASYDVITTESKDTTRLRKLIENYSKCFNTGNDSAYDFIENELKIELDGTEYFLTLKNLIAACKDSSALEVTKTETEKQGDRSIEVEKKVTVYPILPKAQVLDAKQTALDIYNCFGYIYDNEEKVIEILRKVKHHNKLNEVLSELGKITGGKEDPSTGLHYLNAKFNPWTILSSNDQLEFFRVFLSESESNDLLEYVERINFVTVNSSFADFIIQISGFDKDSRAIKTPDRLVSLQENYNRFFNYENKSNANEFFLESINYELDDTGYELLPRVILKLVNEYSVKKDQTVLSSERFDKELFNPTELAQEIFDSFQDFWQKESRVIEIVRLAKQSGKLNELIIEFEKILESKGIKENFHSYLLGRFDWPLFPDGFSLPIIYNSNLNSFLRVLFGDVRGDQIFEIRTGSTGLTDNKRFSENLLGLARCNTNTIEIKDRANFRDFAKNYYLCFYPDRKIIVGESAEDRDKRELEEAKDFILKLVEEELTGTGYLSITKEVVQICFDDAKKSNIAQRESFLENIDSHITDIYQSFGIIDDSEEAVFTILKRAKHLECIDELRSSFKEKYGKDLYQYLTEQLDAYGIIDSGDVYTFLKIVYDRKDAKDIYEFYSWADSLVPTRNGGFEDFIKEMAGFKVSSKTYNDIERLKRLRANYTQCFNVDILEIIKNELEGTENYSNLTPLLDKIKE